MNKGSSYSTKEQSKKKPGFGHSCLARQAGSKANEAFAIWDVCQRNKEDVHQLCRCAKAPRAK